VTSRNYKKVSLRHTAVLNDNHFSFFLPGHKGDCFYEGNTIIIQKIDTTTDPYARFSTYLAIIFIHSNLNFGYEETEKYPRERKFFAKDVGGQSMRAGGATSLARHTSHRSVGFKHLPNLHPKEPRSSAGLAFRPSGSHNLLRLTKWVIMRLVCFYHAP